jgi:4-carboxymuconolactone decarboxylase
MPDSYLKGLEEIAGLDPENGLLFVEELKKVSPEFATYFVSFAFGNIHARKVLNPQVKELTAIAVLIGRGEGKSHLRLRIQGAARAGCTREEIVEVIIQSIVYVGFTRALLALDLVREICPEPAQDQQNGESAHSAPLSPAVGKPQKYPPPRRSDKSNGAP